MPVPANELKLEDSISLELRLCCPSCGSHLESFPSPLHCAGCQRQFPAPFGIPCLADHPVERSTEFGEQGSHELLEQCEHGPWQHALEHVVGPLSNPHLLLEHAICPARAGWWPLLNLQRSWRVLELGSEWGAITFSLAPMVASIVACDLNLERLRFIRARALQDGVSNVQPLCWGDTSRLPFADREFDLVIFNGFLEEAPCRVSGSPFEVQRALLREAARVLARNGQLLLAGHNRWSRRPRNPFARYRRSRWGYKRLLRSGGLTASRTFIPLPNLHSFSAIVDPTKRLTVQHFFAEHAHSRYETMQVRAKSLLAPLFAPSFGWIATHGEPQTSFLESLGSHVTRALSHDVEPPIECLKYRVTLRELITLELRGSAASPSVMVKIPLSAYCNLRTTLEHQRLRRLEELLASSGDWPEIPKPLLKGTFNNVPYFVQQALPGFTSVRFLRSGRRRNAWKHLATDFIARLHSATQARVHLDEATWNQEVMPLLDVGGRSTEEHTGVSFARIRDYLMKELVGHPWPFVFNHGDYSPGNLLFDGEGLRILGVIDWDRALASSLPLIDLLHALMSARSEVKPADLSELFGNVLLKGLDKEERGLVDHYVQRMGFSVSSSQLKAFLLIEWLLRVSMWMSPQESPWWGKPYWVRHNVKPAGQWLMQVCA